MGVWRRTQENSSFRPCLNSRSGKSRRLPSFSSSWFCEGTAAMTSRWCSERGHSLGGRGRGSFPPSNELAMVDAGSIMIEPMCERRRGGERRRRECVRNDLPQQQRGRVTTLSGDDNDTIRTRSNKSSEPLLEGLETSRRPKRDRLSREPSLEKISQASQSNQKSMDNTCGKPTLADYATVVGPHHFNSIAKSRVNATSMEMKLALIHLVKSNQFNGLLHESPYDNLTTFNDICNTVKLNEVHDDAISMSLFPFSLGGNAKLWLNSFLENSFTEWEEYKAIVSVNDEKEKEREKGIEEERKEKVELKGRKEKKERKIEVEREEKEKIVIEERKEKEECSKKEKEMQSRCFDEIFNKLGIKILVTEALQQIFEYAKFLKKLLKRKKYLKEDTIEVQGKALIDLGSNINLMHLAILEKIGGYEVKPARMTLFMADGSTKRPYGVVEGVMVQTDNLRFLVEFVIMEMGEDLGEDLETPIILGRPFMKTAKVIINVDDRTIALKDQEEDVIFNVFIAKQGIQVRKTSLKATYKDAPGTSTKAAKPSKKGKKCFLSQVKEEEKDNKEKCVHQDFLEKHEELRPGLPVKFNKKLWVVKELRTNGLIEIESPISRRVKSVKKTEVRKAWKSTRKEGSTTLRVSSTARALNVESSKLGRHSRGLSVRKCCSPPEHPKFCIFGRSSATAHSLTLWKRIWMWKLPPPIFRVLVELLPRVIFLRDEGMSLGRLKDLDLHILLLGMLGIA
ncbi:hypothetical protein V8G54_013603 [Vigna mungo]|uniref:Retrotransposon gag domain-containing protein n=1 Tax=Vigna mungo TaxID=3915 RepID=A0AAQ3S3E7_VIGMU